MAKIKTIGLSWIVVSDLKKAKKFFTESVGLKVVQDASEMNWIELAGHDGNGARLGICEVKGAECEQFVPGQNAINTFSVDDIEKARAEVSAKGVQLLGEIIEVPGHVKMQLFVDNDGNKFQLVQELDSHH